MNTGDPRLRIGELARRSGVSTDLLRAWERRYGLLSPVRSDGGYRLYSAEDVRRIAEMRRHLAAGLAPAEAASVVAGSHGPATALADHAERRTSLLGAVADFDGAAVELALDDLFDAVPLAPALEQVVLPFLRDLGRLWRRGEVSVAQEHLATQVVRSHLLARADRWQDGPAPMVLACLPGERHDLGLIAFGLVAASYGRGIVYLGPDTPVAAAAQAARRAEAHLVVMVALSRRRLTPVRRELADLARTHPLLLGGAGVAAADAADIGARWLPHGPVEVAQAVSAFDPG